MQVQLPKSETRTIGDYQYKVVQLGARKGRGVAVKLAKVLGPASGAEDDGAAIAKVIEGLNEADLEAISDAFAACTSFSPVGDGTRWPELAANFDYHFAGRYGEMLLWLQFCVELNFGSFLGVLGAKKGDAAPTEMPVAA